jgi:thiamine-phosphate pyrophosphorylase
MADASFGDPVALAIRLVGAGCRVLQLRCKGWSTDQRIRAAEAVLASTRPAGALLIINDDVACAAAVGADGVHLGQGDGSLAVARRALPRGAVVGRSTHDGAEIRGALEEHADYIGFGPVFPTSTKDTGFSPQGLERLRAACAAFPGPVVAIGGITVARVSALASAGAHGWAVGSGIWRTPDPDAALVGLVTAVATPRSPRAP